MEEDRQPLHLESLLGDQGVHPWGYQRCPNTPVVGESTNVSWQAVTTALHAAATAAAAAISVPNVATTAGVTHIERQSVHAINELVESCMCCILDSRCCAIVLAAVDCINWL
jgi:hypothetical protein